MCWGGILVTMKNSNEDLNRPKNLSPLGKRAHKVIVEVLRRHGMTYTGGCKAFWSPQEWKDRGESYGLLSELVVVYDGGDLVPFFCPEEDVLRERVPAHVLYERMREALEAVGLYWEQCTCWYSAIYEHPDFS